MFHIKVSYTSSFSAAFRSLTQPFIRSYIRLHSSADRVENRDLLLLFWLGFFYFTFRDYDERISGRKFGCGWGKMKMSRDRAVKKFPTVTDRNSFFFCTKTRKNLSQLKKFLLWFFFFCFSSSKNSFVCFLFSWIAAECMRAQLRLLCVHESILSVKIYYKRRKRKSRRCHEKYYERCWCKPFISK